MQGRSVARFVARRLGFLLLTVILTSLIIFTVTQYLPGDVARIILGREASETAIQALREDLGLDRPLPLQYLAWLTDFIRGDWGDSYSTQQAIRPLVLERLGNSLRLAGLTLLIAVPLAIALGVIAALIDGPEFSELGWSIWALSWAAAIVLAVYGLVLASTRYLHRPV